MGSRQFSRLPIQELEKLFEKKRTNADMLTSILAELSHRKTSRAKALRRRVLQGLAVHGISGKVASTPKQK
jgi:hypothetical protein